MELVGTVGANVLARGEGEGGWDGEDQEGGKKKGARKRLPECGV